MLSLVIEAGGGTRQALVLDPQWVKIWKTIETTIFCCRPSLSLSSPYSVCSTKGEATQQNTKTEKRKNENTKRKEKKRDKI